jgi:hypothetical protein
MLEGLVLPWQEGSGVEVTINMLLGGACGKVRWRGEHDIRHSQFWKQRPSHQQKRHHQKAGRSRLAVRRRLWQRWRMQ